MRDRRRKPEFGRRAWESPSVRQARLSARRAAVRLAIAALVAIGAALALTYADGAAVPFLVFATGLTGFALIIIAALAASEG